MKKYIHILCLLTLYLGTFTSPIYGQDETPPKDNVRTAVANQHALSVGYLGQAFTRPGVHVGYERSLRTFETSRTRKNGRQIKKLSSWQLGPALGFWVHPRNSNGLLLDVAFKNRRTRPKGLQFQYGLGAGYLHIFRNQPTFVANDNGGFDERRWATSESTPQLNLFVGLGQHRSYAQKGGPDWEIKLKGLYHVIYGTSSRFNLFLELNLLLPHTR